jgi:anaerobic dimethyl sulfoxide reductase subunit A
VLPVSSSLEQDFSCGSGSRVHENKEVGRKIIEPFYECKTDADIIFALAEKLGFGEDIFPKMSVKQAQFNSINGMTVLRDDDGEEEPLLTITQEDLDFYEVEGTVQEGRLPIREFLETGYYQVERKDGDRFTFTYDQAFREDPEANPVKTKSGKYEIYCQSLKDYYELACFHDIDALPKYKASVDGYEQTLTDPEFPFQFYTPHINRQAHSMWSNNRHLTEVYANDLVMSSYDAEKLGFRKGDWIEVSTSEGSLVRRVNPIPNMMPGVTFLGQGNWRELDQETGVDYGGNVNQITKSVLLGDAYQGYNSMLVKLEKWSGKELLPDYLRPPIIPLGE